MVLLILPVHGVGALMHGYVYIRVTVLDANYDYLSRVEDPIAYVIMFCLYIWSCHTHTGLSSVVLLVGSTSNFSPWNLI